MTVNAHLSNRATKWCFFPPHQLCKKVSEERTFYSAQASTVVVICFPSVEHSLFMMHRWNVHWYYWYLPAVNSEYAPCVWYAISSNKAGPEKAAVWCHSFGRCTANTKEVSPNICICFLLKVVFIYFFTLVKICQLLVHTYRTSLTSICAYSYNFKIAWWGFCHG